LLAFRSSTFDLNNKNNTEIEAFAGGAAEVNANYRVLVARRTLGLMDVETVAEDWYLKEEELVVQRVEVGLQVQIFIITIYVPTKLLSHISKSWQVMHWNRIPQIGSLPQ
jgi:hypothetical protein